MIRVKNKKVISTISRKSLAANRSRNGIAVIAIALTTLLFTSLFTIAGTMVNSFQQQSFRQVGGDMHGSFKYLSAEQVETLAADPLIVKSAKRLMLGSLGGDVFSKTQAEISYMDSVRAKGSFCTPTQGTLPQEGSKEIACDTRILSLLGVEPRIGAELTLQYGFASDRESTFLQGDTFTLSGWWEYDPACVASQAIVPQSYIQETLLDYVPDSKHDATGTWTLEVYLKSAAHIEDDLKQILARNAYQTDDVQAENFIGIGVNWAYVGAQIAGNADLGTMVALAGILLLIIFTGYLIIFNIFQISVANDIRFYGLLKTIGTTAQQIRRIIRRQALLLSVFGIPIGLLLGYLCGNLLAPVVMSTMSYKTAHSTANPLIFIGATLFSLITVLLSCYKPGRIAGKVSPVEAVRYSERRSGGKGQKRGSDGTKLFRMALGNLGRNKKKTALVVVSLSLAVVLLQGTVTFTGGFDMDKYLEKFVVSDFILGDADYFSVGTNFDALPEEAIVAVEAQGGITESGRVYANNGYHLEFVSEEWYRARYSRWEDAEGITQMLSRAIRDASGRVADHVQLYGMEPFPLDQLTVLEGDLAPLYDPSQNAIAAVYLTDDYGKPHEDSNWAKVGDTVTLRHVQRWERYDTRSGLALSPEEMQAESEYFADRPLEYQDVSYTVAARVTMRNSMSFRYYGSDEFILNAAVYQRDMKSTEVMNYLMNTEAGATAAMESFLRDYTEQVNSLTDFESKRSYSDEFEGFRSMFLLLGGTLCAIIGLVGVLNFFNAVLTSILTRKRECAMLQSIGMTGQQLRRMLMLEGLYYALFVLGFSLLFCLASGPILDVGMSSMFWFFSYHFTLWPILFVAPLFILLGLALPLLLYRLLAKQSIVERLRDVE